MRSSWIALVAFAAALVLGAAPAAAQNLLLHAGSTPGTSAAGGGGGGSASLNWRSTSATATANGTSLTTSAGGNSFIAGKVIVLIVWADGANGGTDCPTTPVFTKKGPYTSSYYGSSYVLCLRVSDGTESGAFQPHWPNSLTNASAGYMLELWNASNFDSSGSGGAPTVGSPSGSVSTVPAAGSRFTSAANETLVSYLISDDDQRSIVTIPVNGGTVSYNPGCGGGAPFNVFWGIQIETGLASGADVYRTTSFAMGSSPPPCASSTNGGAGFSVALVP